MLEKINLLKIYSDLIEFNYNNGCFWNHKHKLFRKALPPREIFSFIAENNLFYSTYLNKFLNYYDSMYKVSELRPSCSLIILILTLCGIIKKHIFPRVHFLIAGIYGNCNYFSSKTLINILLNVSQTFIALSWRWRCWQRVNIFATDVE